MNRFLTSEVKLARFCFKSKNSSSLCSVPVCRFSSIPKTPFVPRLHQNSTFISQTYKSPKSIYRHSEFTRKFASPSSPVNREGNPNKIALAISELSKRLGVGSTQRTLFANLTLSFFHGAKIGIVGVNGSGKSSLMKILAGVDKDFDGKVQPHTGMRIGFLSQEPMLDESLTVGEVIENAVQHKRDLVLEFEKVSEQMADPEADIDKLAERQTKLQHEIDELNCWEVNHEIEQASAALRCAPPEANIINLSGGEKRRIALCRLLLSRPDILLLDEPTNHLDAESVTWLELYLQNYPGLVIAITHDRYFLDNVAGFILEIDSGRAFPFRGNYAQWLEHKHRRITLEDRKNAALEKVLARELEWLRSNAGAQRAKSKARVRGVEMLQEQRDAQLMARKSEGGALLIPEGPRLTGNVISVENLCYEVDGLKLIQDLNFKMAKGDILGIVGPNGTGKTTLLKLLVGEKSPTSGKITVGKSVQFGYNSQTREKLNDKNMVWQEIIGAKEFVTITPSVILPARAYVAQFNFCGNDQTKFVANLSGGERNRLHLAKSMINGCNVLLLDEPTNDLDVDTLRALEEALNDFDGSAIIVSHDRWFLDRVCTSLLSFEPNTGKVVYFEGNFSQWEHHKKHVLKLKPEKSVKYKQINL